MSIAEILAAIQDSAIAHAISKSNHMVAAGLQIVHVMGFIFLLAALVLISLRLLNLVMKNEPMSVVRRDANRFFHIGLVLTVLSGTLMFVATPKLYFYKFAFELKKLLFVGAIALQFALYRRIAAQESPHPVLARATVGVSLIVWFGIGLAGRMIGFT